VDAVAVGVAANNSDELGFELVAMVLARGSGTGLHLKARGWARHDTTVAWVPGTVRGRHWGSARPRPQWGSSQTMRRLEVEGEADM
jgi:hypothetical protein